MTAAKRYTIVECHNDDEVWFKMKEVAHGEYVLYSDYKELEQELKDSELRRKDLLMSLQTANAQKRKLEQDKAELVEALRLIKHKLETDPAITDTIWIDDNPMCSETAVDRINDLLDIDE